MISPERARDLLWADLRLVVVDIEALFDEHGFRGDARAEVDRAIEHVLAGGQPVLLAAQPRRVRRQQHATVEAAGLTSQSGGVEPARAVEVRAREAGPTVAFPPVRGGEFRAISVAVVTCERGKVGKTWTSLVNPGVPVDPETFRKHGLTDRDLRGAPAFPAVAADLLTLLTPADNETLVFVAHNAGFDLGVLRAEFRRAGLQMPEVGVLDTMGQLPALVGVAPSGRSLEALVSALGLTNRKPHSADGDAEVTAAAACAMLDRAAGQGQSDISTLLAAVGGWTTATVRASQPGQPMPSRPVHLLPEAHLVGHMVLAARPSKTALVRWVALADDCARLRCPDAAGLVAVALAPPTVVLAALAEVVDRRAAAGDGPGAAAALDAVGLVFDLACPVPLPGDARTRYPIGRQEAIDLWHRMSQAVAHLDACPTCQRDRACPRDELVRRIAPAVLNPTWARGKMLKGFSISAWLPHRGNNGGWFSHRREPIKPGQAGPELADAALGFLLRAYRAHGEEADSPGRVLFQLNRVMREGGCREPVVWEMWAWEQARGGRAEDFRAAIDACDQGLAYRPATTASAWESLDLTRSHLLARLASLERGTAIRHHPGARARRTRPLRFTQSAAPA